MFFITLQDVLECIPDYIEDYSVFTEMIASIIISSLWLRKFLKEKRAEAFLGFYTKLSLLLNSLQKKLDEKDRLNISTPEIGNIYSLIYTSDCAEAVCPNYEVITDEELEFYKNITDEIKRIILEADNNVYPKGTKREEWYKSQELIFYFCLFIEDRKSHYSTNISKNIGDSEYKHIKKCKELINAIDYIQQSIKRVTY